ncbi:MAG: glutamine synthetase, partial [Treponemataceae bacterium]|nr:glutamine synthetase [Treponemataceae bacterium]
LSPDARGLIAGILFRIREMTAFLNPLRQSYERLAWNGAPREIAWTRAQYNQLIRVPEPTGHGAYLKLRSPDASCNQYLALALILSAGLEGIEQRRQLAEPKDENSPAWNGKTAFDSLPQTMDEARSRAEASAFVRSVLTQATADAFFAADADDAACGER